MINKKNKIRNKKASVSATLTWIVATFIILFILILYLVAVSILDYTKGGIKISREAKTNTDLVLIENFLGFLNTPVENDETIYELISKADVPEGKKERADIFEREAKKFIEENLAIGGFFDLSRDRVWIRVYNSNEEIKQEGFNWIYGLHEGYTSNGYCDPYMANAVLINIFVTPNKKIVICTNIEK